MSALDVCEPPIIRAFQKDGWRVARKPHMIQLVDDRFVYADMRLQRINNGSIENIIVVEVKCFTNPDNDLQELYTAIGQYQLYRAALLIAQSQLPIYLAMPSGAYDRLSQQPAMIAALRITEIKWVLVDIEKEEIISWNR